MGIKEADLHITKVCDGRCGYCYVDPHDDMPVPKSIFCDQPEFGSTGVLKCVIDALRNIAGVEDLVLVGGDPCRHPDIVPLLKRAKEVGLNTVVLSNTHAYQCGGHPVSMPEVTPLLDEIDFTLHGSSAKAHNKFNGMDGSYQMATERIKEFMLFRKPGQSVGIILNMVPEIIDDLPAIMENIIGDLELNPDYDFFSIQRIAPSGKARFGYEEWQINREMVERAFSVFDDIKNRYGIETKACIDVFPWCAVPEKYWHYLEPMRGGCNWGKPGGVLSVLMDGTLQRCALSERGLGVNILNIDTPEDFDSLYLNNPALRAFNERRHLDDKCLKCELLEKCGGGCTIAGGIGKGDPYEKFNPLDPIASVIKGHDYLAT